MKGFIIPLIEIVFIGGIGFAVGFFVCKAILNVWSKQAKFFIKYKILRRSCPASSIKWIMDCINQGIGYYDAKKSMMVGMVETDKMNETLWLFDEVLKEMGNKRTKEKQLGKELPRHNTNIKEVK